MRTKVENAISSLLPHGRVPVENVARELGMSRRTLARKLSDEGLNFTDILQQLRRDLAVRYLRDRIADVGAKLGGATVGRAGGTPGARLGHCSRNSYHGVEPTFRSHLGRADCGATDK